MDTADSKQSAQLAARRYVAERLELRPGQQLNSAMVKALLSENENLKRNIEANLLDLTEKQLKAADTSVSLLRESESKMPLMHARFTEIDSLSKDAAELLVDFPYHLSQVRENLVQTRKLLRDMLQVDERVEKAKNLLEDEERLLEAHAELATLVEMRDQAVMDAKRAGDRYVIDGVDRYFKTVGKLENRFDALLKQHMDATFELARKRPSLLKQCLKVIELEEKADRNRPQELQKNYSVMLLEKLRESLENRFNAVFSNAIQTDITDALRIVEQIYDNLPIIQQVNRYFPSKYQMYEFYAGNIHRNLRACLGNVATRPGLTPGDVVNTYYWANVSYSKKLEGVGLIPAKWPVSDVLKPAIQTYATHLRSLMNQWSTRLLERDRVNPSYVEMPKNIMTDSIVTLFKFVNQQLDLVSHTKDSHFIFVVAKESLQVIFEFQKAQTDLLTNHLTELAPKYLMATLNNNAKAYDYTEEFRFRVRGLLSEPELTRFDKEEKQTLEDGFEYVRKLAVSSIVQIIFDLFKDNNVLSRFFTKEWLRPAEDEYGPMEIIVQTFSEALDRTARKHLKDKYLSDVAKDALDRLLQRYVQELCSKSGFTAATADRVEKDRVLVETTFSSLIQGKSYLTRRLNLLASIAKFIIIPMNKMDIQQFILTYNSLLEDYPDLSPDVLKRIVGGRSDSDKEIVQEVISACRGILPSQKQFKPFFAVIPMKGAQAAPKKKDKDKDKEKEREREKEKSEL